MAGAGKPRAVPLVFDWDGTLHRSDLMVEAGRWCLRHDRRLLGAMLWTWLRRGRAAAKLLAERGLPEEWLPELPWDERTVALLRGVALTGRPVVVATGSPEGLARRVVDAAPWAEGLTVTVLGTVRPDTNLTAARKAAALVARYGDRGFDYAGNSRDDLAVWAMARQAVVVNAKPSVAAAARRLGNVVQEFE